MKNIIKLTSLVMALVLMTLTFAACESKPVETEPAKDTEVVEAEKNVESEEPAADTEKYSVTFYSDEVPAYIADRIQKGLKVYDSENDVNMGIVTEALIEDSICYASNEGKLVLTSKNGYRSVMITTTVEAVKDPENGWYIGDTLYGIGHKGTLHVGITEVELALRSVEAVD